MHVVDLDVHCLGKELLKCSILSVFFVSCSRHGSS
jgi:hypothetical protein